MSSPKNFISNKDETVPMFNSPWLDWMTKVHYTVPLIIYIPVVLVSMYYAIFNYHLKALEIIPLFVLGLLVWTLTEYNMHRFLFHWMPPGKIGAQINFMFHGVHHDYPRDSMRLVMVPVISMPLGFIFYFAFRFILGAEFVAPFFAGLVSGYLFYDMTHYALHHANFRSKFWLELKQHHMTHHYTDPNNGFGVSTKFWDLIYRTTFKKTPRELVADKKTESPVEAEHV